jgi:hypothetical protein
MREPLHEVSYHTPTRLWYNQRRSRREYPRYLEGYAMMTAQRANAPSDTDKLIDICRRNDVSMIGVFGSIARGEATEMRPR